MTTSKDLYVSPSQIKLFQQCPRSWYLRYVLNAPDDQGAGGQYLQRGQEFDALADSYVAGTPAPDVPQLAQRQLAEARRYLPEPGTAVTQHKYRVAHPEGFVIGGKADFRRPGRIWDTKTTSDRGPGEGAGPDRPAYALTDETLGDDPQALTYAWCEFQGDLALEACPATWVYVSKAPAPRAWTAHHDFTRAECDVWFADVALPIVRRMRDYRDARLRSDTVDANPEGCRRCFVVWSCPGAFEGPNVYGVEGPIAREGNLVMAFDLNKLKRGPAATPAGFTPLAQVAAKTKPAPLVEVLTESVIQATMARLERVEAESVPEVKPGATNAGGMPGLVAINRPEADVLHVGTIDGTPAALAQLVLEESSPGAQAPAREEPAAAAAAPKARRGRPPKGGGTGSAPATVTPPTPSADVSSGADSPAAESAKPSVIEQAKAVREAALALVVELNGLIGGGA